MDQNYSKSSVSLAISILGLFFLRFLPAGLILSLVGLILGVKAKKESTNELAQTAVIISTTSLIVAIVLGILMLLGLGVSNRIPHYTF